MRTLVRRSIDREVARVIFEPEAPGKPPTLDYEVLADLEAAVADLATGASADRVRAVIVESASPKYFVVGANLEALKSIDKDSIGPWVERGHQVFNALADLPVPVIARVAGYCLGGGLELAMACDFIAATTAARFGLPEAGLGFVPGWGGCARLPALVGPARARELIATGRIIDAAEACRIGLAVFAGSESELDAWLSSTLDAIRRNSRLSLSLTKRILAAGVERRPAALLAEATASAVCLASGDTARRLEAFFKAREKKS